jgi:hypothetical protein
VGNSGNETFPVQYSILASDALKDRLLHDYALGNSITCGLFTAGINDVYL